MSDASELPSISAPFTKEQVKQLEAQQEDPLRRLSCRYSDTTRPAVLVPTTDGLKCPKAKCGYVRTTVADPSPLSG